MSEPARDQEAYEAAQIIADAIASLEAEGKTVYAINMHPALADRLGIRRGSLISRLKTWWARRGLEPGDPDTPEWHEYRRKCREIERRNAACGGYQGYPLPPGYRPDIPPRQDH